MRLILFIIQIYIAGWVLALLYLFAFQGVEFSIAAGQAFQWPRLLWDAIGGGA